VEDAFNQVEDAYVVNTQLNKNKTMNKLGMCTVHISCHL